MASWIPPPTFPINSTVASASINVISGDLLFLYERPYGSFYQSTPTNVNTSAFTSVPMDSTNFSGYGVARAGASVQVPITGIYAVSFRLAFAAPGATGGGNCVLYQNTTPQIWGSSITDLNADPRRQSSGSGVLSCSASDLLVLYGWQATGSGLNTQGGLVHTAIEVVFVGSQ